MISDTVAIIPCTNQKSDVPGKARDVWVGGHFQLILAHAEIFYDRVLVMSYKYGLISPNDEIEPYDIDIRLAPAADRLRWWFKMKGDIKNLCETQPLLVALYTGDVERARIVKEFVNNGVNQIIVPFEGLKVGERMERVYDLEPPFDKQKAKEGAYAVTLEPTTAGAKYLPPPTTLTDEIEWEN